MFLNILIINRMQNDHFKEQPGYHAMVAVLDFFAIREDDKHFKIIKDRMGWFDVKSEISVDNFAKIVNRFEGDFELNFIHKVRRTLV